MNRRMSEALVDIFQLVHSIQGGRHVGRGPLLYQEVNHHFEFVNLIPEADGEVLYAYIEAILNHIFYR